MFDKNVTGSQRWKAVLLNLIMWLIYCNLACFFPIFLIWQMAQPSSGSTHTSKYKELIQRLRSATPTQPKGHCEPSSSHYAEPCVFAHQENLHRETCEHENSLKTKQELGTKRWNPAHLSVSCCSPTVICVLQATSNGMCDISPSRPPLRSTGVHIPGLKCLCWPRQKHLRQ